MRYHIMVRRPRDLDSIFGDDGSPIFLHSELKKIEINRLKSYIGHSFKQYSNIKMSKMVESVNSVGILEPIIVYENNGEYIILAGYNRVEASKRAKKITIPAIIKKDLTKVQQVEIMNFTNFFQRGTGDCSISELAKAFKMEYDALLEEKSKNKGELEGNVIRKYLADMYEMSDSKMQRYLTISKLIPELLDCLDIKKINASVALILANIDSGLQRKAYNWILGFEAKINIKIAKKIKDILLEEKELDGLNEFDLIKNDKDNEKKFNHEKEILKTIDFISKTLPKWLDDHGIDCYKSNMSSYLINVLEQIYEESPNILRLCI